MARTSSQWKEEIFQKIRPAVNRFHLKYFGFLIVLFYLVEGGAMSSIFGTEVVLFSPMEEMMTF